MKACGVIAEYNPFHNGHAYQLTQAREKAHADVMVVVMSGNYVQRGEPAIVDKWQRARMALTNGADLVIELPFAISSQPADRFAAGALQILDALNCQTLAFGVEKSEFDYKTLLNEIAPKLKRPQFTVNYTKTYATQWNDFLEEKLGQRIEKPNQLLALSYAYANAQLDRPLELLPITRIGVAHDDLNSTASYASATAIRQLLLAGEMESVARFVPYDLSLFSDKLLSWQDLWPYLHYALNVSWPQELTPIYQMSEGLEYRFWQQNQKSTDFDQFLQLVKSKRYTYARLRRLALYTVLQVTAADITAASTVDQPIHVLGFNSVGQAYLRELRKNNAAHLITKVTADLGKPSGSLGLQVRVDRLIEQLTGVEQNFRQHIIMIK